MRRLRTLPTRTLVIAGLAALALAAGGGVAVAELSGDAPKPEPKALDQAVYDALRAPEVAGVTARVEFENNLIPAGALPQGSASPLLSGADGRLWITNDGRFRLELQSEAGDAQVVSDGERVQVYDPQENTAYRATIPEDDAERAAKRERGEKSAPTLADVREGIERLTRYWTLSGAEPGTAGGEPSYTVRVSPKDDGGLLGAAELAWQASNGVPLRAAVYADGQEGPVLELKATEVSFGAVAAQDVAIRTPQGAEVVDVNPERERDAEGKPRKVEGLDAVRDRLDFELAAPATLAGLPRQEVGLVEQNGDQGAVVTYGEGMGAIAVIQKPAEREDARERAERRGGDDYDSGELDLPQVNIDGATGTELATALGTVISFERDGIAYVVAGSVPPQAAEQAARDLR